MFHGPGCEPWSWFDELCERHPIVAIGSIVPDNTSAKASGWLNDVFSRICDRDTGEPRVKIHGLRMTSRMGDYPFASVDGSTWVTAAKNGAIPSELGQVRAPWLTNRERKELWIKAWDRIPKCERFLFDRERTQRHLAFMES